MEVKRKTTLGVGVCLCLLSLLASFAEARIVKLRIDRKEFYGTFERGRYVRIEGMAFGEVSKAEPIALLDLAPTNERGKVEYATPFTLVVPTDLRKGNRRILFDVQNRGRNITPIMFNDVPVIQGSPSYTKIGNGFLMEQGFLVVIAAWEVGHGIRLPKVVKEGKAKPVTGIGFLAVRDLVAFLRYAAKDDAGIPNPLSGFVEKAYGVGYSQTGRFLRDFLYQGFNVSEEGKKVFDGAFIHVPGAGRIDLNYEDALPTRFPTYRNPNVPHVDVPPFSYDKLLIRPDSDPYVIHTNTSSDYWSRRASLVRTEGGIPSNVRIYDFASAPHVVWDVLQGCELPIGVLDWRPVARALLLALDRWATDGTPPPGSRLSPLVATDDPKLLRLPGYMLLVPAQDEDGNELGGVRLPDLEAPLGTYGGINLPLSNMVCVQAGSFIPFARTRTERLRAQDDRLSLEERYNNHQDYVQRIIRATEALVKERLLLPEDARAIITRAEASDVLR